MPLNVASMSSRTRAEWRFGLVRSGRPYRPSTANPPASPRGVVWARIDLDAHDRASAVHRELELQIVEQISSNGRIALSPGPGDPPFDIAFAADDSRAVIVEVKSLPVGAEVQQLRLGLGQVLDYRAKLGERLSVTPIVAVDREPPDSAHWQRVYDHAGVGLSWPPDLWNRIRAAIAAL